MIRRMGDLGSTAAFPSGPGFRNIHPQRYRVNLWNLMWWRQIWNLCGSSRWHLGLWVPPFFCGWPWPGPRHWDQTARSPIPSCSRCTGCSAGWDETWWSWAPVRRSWRLGWKDTSEMLSWSLRGIWEAGKKSHFQASISFSCPPKSTLTVALNLIKFYSLRYRISPMSSC